MTPKTTELVSVASSLPAMSQDEMVDVIKQTVAKGATDAELQMFMAVARRFDLDPFAREVFFIKDENRPNEAGRVQTGRDGFLAIANRHPAYEGMTSDVVFQGDTFRRTETGVEHTYDLASRKGTIIGAYAIVYRSDRRIPQYAFARFSEYSPAQPKGWSPWHKHPSAMILKCAETAALKKAFSISGLTPIGISEPDDDYVDAPQEAPRPALPYAHAADAQFGHESRQAGHREAPRPHVLSESPSADAGDGGFDPAELEAVGQTRFGEDAIPE